MNSSVAPTTSRETRQRALKAGLAAACCALAASACSSNAGKRISGAGTYRTGAVGTALSRAADRGPAAVTRAQARLGANGRSPARRAAAAEAERAAPRRTASRPVPNPLDVFRAQAAAGQAVAAAEPRPTLQRVAYEPRGLAERALTSRTILAPALTEAAGPAARAVVPARVAPVNRAVAGWSLSRPQMMVLAAGLLLSILAALIAAWSAARRRRIMAEPRIAAPTAANDAGRPEPVSAGKRAVGPQYVLPLNPAAAQPQPQPRTYSVKAGGAAKLTSTRA